MNEPEGQTADAAAREEGGREARAVLLMEAGGLHFALFAEEVECVAEASVGPVPLPGAPAAVLGVVCVRGRMRTLLDPTVLLARSETSDGDAPTDAGEPRTQQHDTPRLYVALRGDEQLALSVERAARVAGPPDEALQPASQTHAAVRGVFTNEGARVHLLDPARLFETAMQGAERRRKR